MEESTRNWIVGFVLLGIVLVLLVPIYLSGAGNNPLPDNTPQCTVDNPCPNYVDQP